MSTKASFTTEITPVNSGINSTKYKHLYRVEDSQLGWTGSTTYNEPMGILLFFYTAPKQGRTCKFLLFYSYLTRSNNNDLH